MKDLATAMVFLKARLREDEAAARAVKPGKDEGVAGLQARVLADVKAKRRLVAWVEANFGTTWKANAEDQGLPFWQKTIVELIADVPEYFRSPVIYGLLTAYEDHPDFQPEWKLIDDEPEYEPVDYEKRR
ncbi:DUF6221 family protein [Streptomyces sp. PanSC9]|uniref:DUF6221 family protein n=1 Tax=Streptomyces sp. PanSC9 TaxID=1520461 RepID=UPI000F9970AE|nr:DUF6221 family protein [Streptomyces sp. PanSC9]ROP53305.1 hypothetical protein EDD94_2808 [Streptomyces sp. PanSC9]